MNEPQRRYPVIFQIPGFGGTHFIGKQEEPIEEDNQDGVEFLRVILDPELPVGASRVCGLGQQRPRGRSPHQGIDPRPR